ncbi:2-amino-4-hydroxy-6-hydroxymethyldihydropteridine diphosphokinase [Thermicanus aegyptius]|uniref:2-amino-4-hydroxy-6- hydroxymethyldihydropteridine diphosphokinase n=1 Tax=Thermicanus aegyptius TaxID=94009 RepID=UPI0003F8E34C|nr:2-amino-4-hydroxy-6-hydroxymethyldihydropteridine diphosphokinase [Thermicanus aegyptius]
MDEAGEKVYISFGSNQGDRLGFLGKGLLLLSLHREISISRISSVYETDPVGYLEQPLFYNMVAEARSTLSPYALLSFLLEVERKLGRVRIMKNGPRTLDLDLLLYGDRLICEENLIVPHPRLHERAFVIVPLWELEPTLLLPHLGKSIDEIKNEIGEEGVRRVSLLPNP